MSNTESLKVVIPMAGLGTRLRPHTWSKPKQLVSVAGKTVLDHVLDTLASVPNPRQIELIAIVGYLGDQIEEHIQKCYPEVKTHIVVQENPAGQSHAIKLAEEHLSGPMLMVFADTLIMSNFAFIANEQADGVAWVKPVADPRRFGVASVGKNGLIDRMVEKPQDMSNNLAVVGVYYFKDSKELISAIDEQMKRDIQLKGEYYLADAINIMLERGMKMRTEQVEVWLDAGTPEALLETNRYLLAHSQDNSEEVAKKSDLVICPPVFIHPTARVSASIIGPNASIGADCKIENSIIRDSILEDEAEACNIILEKSLVGRRATLHRRATMVNAGDNTEVSL